MVKALTGLGSGSWILTAEHTILRLVSLAFSLASAYAIRVFFEPLDAADPGEKVITWIVAAGFGVLGYVVSRGLVHRMMQKESIWAYAPICFLVELVDISCNYVLAASVVREAWWLNAVPENQRGVLTVITYVVLSAIPLVSLFLAVVDMDLERSKGVGGVATGKPLGNRAGIKPVGNRAGFASVQPQGNQNAGGSTNGAMKRAQYWNNRQGQQGGQGQQGSQGHAGPLTYDPDKDVAVAVQ